MMSHNTGWSKISMGGYQCDIQLTFSFQFIQDLGILKGVLPRLHSLLLKIFNVFFFVNPTLIYRLDGQ